MVGSKSTDIPSSYFWGLDKSPMSAGIRGDLVARLLYATSRSRGVQTLAALLHVF